MSFHVPEAARIREGEFSSDASYGNNGAFMLSSPSPGWQLLLICADETEDDAVGDLAAWEHVSVSVRHEHQQKLRTPTWIEMAWVKKLCWDDEDVVVQFHPRASEYVNIHPHVLHLWRWKHGEFPTPPINAV